MEETLPEYSVDSLATHAVVRTIIDRCTAATRQWIQGDLTRRYLGDLCGLAGACIASAEHSGLEGHRTGTPELKREADVLLARLIEARELLRYPRYAAASMANDTTATDTPEIRKKWVDYHERTEPGHQMPEP